MRRSDNEVKQARSEKSDEELYDMLYVRPNDYADDAIEIATQEFAIRNLDAPRLRELAAAGWNYGRTTCNFAQRLSGPGASIH
jgi:hypothetical protein